jgi:hypothetical protein
MLRNVVFLSWHLHLLGCLPASTGSRASWRSREMEISMFICPVLSPYVDVSISSSLACWRLEKATSKHVNEMFA